MEMEMFMKYYNNIININRVQWLIMNMKEKEQ